MTDTVGGDDERRDTDLRDNLRDLKKELEQTRRLLDRHLAGTTDLEKKLAALPTRGKHQDADWKRTLSGPQAAKWRTAYLALREKGVSKSDIATTLVSRGNDAHDAELLVEALEKSIEQEKRNDDHGHL